MESVKSSEVASTIARESAITKWIIAPLTFLSFLFSLALVDTQTQATRAASRHGRPPPDGRLSFFRRFLFGDDQVPYAYVRSPSEGDGASPGGKDGKEGGWYFHSKQRKLMKMEVSDAFRIRKRVALGMILVSMVVALVNWVLLRYITRVGMRWMAKWF
ncbi:hypothetical protein F5884DRAFT_772503 [Xylogone sp. PMI_703]|nr:hypothetical protein F5884DRAFT_772503 [Xylogone sp. PMI_703]